MSLGRAVVVLASAALVSASTRPLPAQSFEIVHAFSAASGEPQAPLIPGSDGRLYGTSKTGGFFGRGSVYALTPDGSGGYDFEELHAFFGPDGAEPLAPLIQASDGAFYGTTSKGGGADLGTVFVMSAAGAVTTIHSFSNFDGWQPSGGLVQTGDGLLYGTTTSGGSGFGGVIFRIDPSGSFAVLHEFTGYPVEGSAPLAGLLRASDGRLYGTASDGGSNHQGTIFRIDLAGNYETVAEFDGTNGAYPQSPLMRASNGYFYGTALYGGVFRVGYLGGLVRVPTDTVSGEKRAGLMQASDGMVYGTSSIGYASQVFRFAPDGSDVQIVGDVPNIPLAALLELPDGRLAAPATSGPVFAVDRFGAVDELYRFEEQEGSAPWGALTQGSDGLLYGTTVSGGIPGGIIYGGWGTVFRLSLDGEFQNLHAFDGSDGFGPQDKMIEGSDGWFYGTTATPGSGAGGSIFRIDTAGAFENLHGFNNVEGSDPRGAFAEGAGALYYGVASQGGINGVGSIYRIDGDGQLTKLHDFDGENGATPLAGLLPDAGGFVGTTFNGGENSLGTLFRLESNDSVTTLWSFTGGADGASPNTALIRASDGSVYGGSTNAIYRWPDPGPPAIVHAFGGAEGLYPSALAEVGSGVFYGTTQEGGSGNGYGGTLFRLDSDGTLATLHEFGGPSGGAPHAEPILASDGDLYGTVPFEGPSGAGLVWKYRITGTGSPDAASVTPSSGRAAGGTSIAVEGTGFQPLLVVALGGVDASDTVDVDRRHVRAIASALAPGTLNDLTVTNPDASNSTVLKAWFADFLDVGDAHPFHDYVESIVRAGITAGCGAGNYCPTAAVTRGQMAVFLLKAEHGPAYAPPACTGVFPDVPCPGSFTDWIEQLAAEGITGGCGGGNYCPASPVTRAQMAIFLLKTSLGSSYVPPAAAGIFGDVPAGSFAADWIEDLYGRAITGGCSSSPLLYCPSASNTRGQMAVFLTKTFDLP